MHTNAPTFTGTCMHAYTRPHILTQTSTNTLTTHACTHAHAHNYITCIHTHTHMHAHYHEINDIAHNYKTSNLHFDSYRYLNVATLLCTYEVAYKTEGLLRGKAGGQLEVVLSQYYMGSKSSISSKAKKFLLKTYIKSQFTCTYVSLIGFSTCPYYYD